jgi:hypothetical protein
MNSIKNSSNTLEIVKNFLTTFKNLPTSFSVGYVVKATGKHKDVVMLRTGTGQLEIVVDQGKIESPPEPVVNRFLYKHRKLN